jgi:REP element-mobilizing transposase RayT
MPRSRSSQVSLIDTLHYHCVSRCVRRCFLCGVDNYSGQSYEHRRDWVEARLLFLASIFAIDICAYAVMGNHVHVVLYVDKATADNLTMKEVFESWHRLHKGTLLSQRYLQEDILTDSEMLSLTETANVYRQRLHDISWFMRNLNEYIAREANKEDECTGRFWEGRFKSQALLDENALLACMVYVDLNPIRAEMETTPETSKHTSIYKRTKAIKKKKSQPFQLLPFVGNHKQNTPKGITFSLKDYCELVDCTGRCIREDDTGHIGSHYNPILKRLGLSDEKWLTLTTEFEKHFCYAAGAEQMMQQFTQHTGHQRMRGMCKSKALFRRS